MMKRISIALSLATLAACTMPGQEIDDSELYADSTGAHLPSLQTAAELRIRDLPVPGGYVYDPRHSMIIEYGSTQAGMIRYEGSAPVGDLIEFYRREMPKFDWTLSTMIEREEIRMFFQKTGMICEITIRPATTLSRKSIIQVYYAPKV